MTQHSTDTDSAGKNHQPGVELPFDAALAARRVLVACVCAAIALWVFDFQVRYGWMTHIGSIGSIFDITSEDGLASWFGTAQSLLAAVTLWQISFIVRLRRGMRRVALGWATVAALFTYIAIDDGAALHERIPVRLWQSWFLPVLIVLGVFMFAFLWRQLDAPRSRLFLVASGGCLGVAALLDLLEKLAPDRSWEVFAWLSTSAGLGTGSVPGPDRPGFETVQHFSRSIEQTLEMIAVTLLWYLFLSHLAAIARKRALEQRLGAGADSRIVGVLGNVTLQDLLQLLGMNRRSATLKLRGTGEEGAIFFREGVVIHALAGPLQAEQAIKRLLMWEDAEFEIHDGLAGLPEETLSADVTGLMLTALQALDHERRDGSTVARANAPQGMRGRTGAVALRSRSGPHMRPPAPRHNRRLAWITFSLVVLGVTVGYLLLPVSSEDVAGARLSTLTSDPHAPAQAAVASPAFARSALSPESKPPPPAPTPEPEPTAPLHGYLIATAEPSADVTLDGRHVGSTPLGRLRLRPGEYRLALRNEAVAGLIEDRVTIVAGRTLERRYSFAEFGELLVVVKPWAEVLIDDRVVGQTPMSGVKTAVGEHEVTLRHPELGEKTERVTVRSGQTTLLRVTLSAPTEE